MVTLLENIGNSIVDSLTLTLRRFTAFIFIVFTAGILVGANVVSHNPSMLVWAIVIPLFLSLLAYFSTAFAVVLFIIFGLFLLIL